MNTVCPQLVDVVLDSVRRLRFKDLRTAGQPPQGGAHRLDVVLTSVRGDLFPKASGRQVNFPQGDAHPLDVVFTSVGGDLGVFSPEPEGSTDGDPGTSPLQAGSCGDLTDGSRTRAF